MKGHCLASPSSSDRWIRCTGSLHLLTQYPQPQGSSPQAEYGTQVHDLARLFIGVPTRMKQQLASLYLDTNGYSRQQMDEALGYSEYVDGLVKLLHNPQVSIEKTVCISSVDKGVFGTPDAIIYQPEDRSGLSRKPALLRIIDLKTGRVPVSSVHNSQLLLYAQGAIDTFGYDPEVIVLHIYQNNDRCGINTNDWLIDRGQLAAHTNVAAMRFDEHRRKMYSFNPGTHCRYCPVKQHCAAFSQRHTHVLETLSEAVEPQGQVTISNSDPKTLAALYRIYKGLSPFIDALEARLLETDPAALEGTGVTIRNRKAPLAYQDSAAALQAFKDSQWELDEIAPRALVSPARLRAISEELFALAQPYLAPQGSTQYLAIEKTKVNENSQ